MLASCNSSKKDKEIEVKIRQALSDRISDELAQHQVTLRDRPLLEATPPELEISINKKIATAKIIWKVRATETLYIKNMVEDEKTGKMIPELINKKVVITRTKEAGDLIMEPIDLATFDLVDGTPILKEYQYAVDLIAHATNAEAPIIGHRKQGIEGFIFHESGHLHDSGHYKSELERGWIIGADEAKRFIFDLTNSKPELTGTFEDQTNKDLTLKITNILSEKELIAKGGVYLGEVAEFQLHLLDKGKPVGDHLELRVGKVQTIGQAKRGNSSALMGLNSCNQKGLAPINRTGINMKVEKNERVSPATYSLVIENDYSEQDEYYRPLRIATFPIPQKEQ